MSTWQVDERVPLGEGSHTGGLWARRAMLALLALVVLAALTGLLGVHTSSASASRDGYTMTLRYPGDTFVVYYDAYIQPASQQGKAARVSVIDHGQPAVWFNYRTRLVPDRPPPGGSSPWRSSSGRP